MAETVNERIQYIVKEYYDGNVSAFAKTIGSNKIIITCMACGRQFKPGEDMISVMAKRRKQMETASKPGTWIFLAVIFIFFIWLFSKSDPKSDIAPVNTVAKEAPSVDKVNYETVDEFGNSAIDKCKLILVDSKQVNIESLKRLGNYLNYEMRDNLTAKVMVYSSRKAALMFHSIGSMSKADESYYDKHLIAIYGKAPTRTLIQIYVNGLGGKSIEVNYYQPK